MSIFCLLASSNVISQNCNQGKRLAENTWEKWGPWKPEIGSRTFLKKVENVKKFWNYIASNSGATIEPRFIEFDGGNEQGTVYGKTKRTFVTPSSFENTITVTINKYDGRAKTGVVICSRSHVSGSR